MADLKQLFTEHPASVGESYGEHMGQALGFAGGCFLAGFACLIHALLPFACVKTGSRRITALYDRMVTNRVRTDRRAAAAPAE